MNNIRERARVLRLCVEAGERMDMEEVLDCGCTLDDALSVFSGQPDQNDDRLVPVCCGRQTKLIPGMFSSSGAECLECHAMIADLLDPFGSPVLERGNSYVSVPGEKLIERLGDRHWIVMHEGERPEEPKP